MSSDRIQLVTSLLFIRSPSLLMRENKSALDGIGEEKTEINLLVPEVLMIIALNAMIFFSLFSCPLVVWMYYVSLFLFTTIMFLFFFHISHLDFAFLMLTCLFQIYSVLELSREFTKSPDFDAIRIFVTFYYHCHSYLGNFYIRNVTVRKYNRESVEFEPLSNNTFVHIQNGGFWDF